MFFWRLCSFAPLNERDEGKLRCRADEAENADRMYMGASLSANAEMKKTPGPQAYDTHGALQKLSQFRSPGSVPAAAASRDERAKVCHTRVSRSFCSRNCIATLSGIVSTDPATVICFHSNF